MAVPEQTPYKEYTANGITKIFPLGFDVLAQDHLIVLVNDLEPTVGSWSLDAVNDTVAFALPPANGANIKIRRDTPLERSNDYKNYNSSLKPEAINSDLDNIWRKLQEMGVLNWMIDNNIKDLGDYVDGLNDETKAIFLAEIQKQGISLNQLEQFTNSIYQNLANVAVSKGWFAEFVADGDENQKQINDETTRSFNSISELLNYSPRRNGQTVFLKSYEAVNYALINPRFACGGGHFTYDSSKKHEIDWVFNFNGWVRNANPYSIKASWAGIIADGHEDVAPGFRSLNGYLYSLDVKKKKKLFLEEGIYQINSVTQFSVLHEAFALIGTPSNTDFIGAGKENTTLRLPSNVMTLMSNSGSLREFAIFYNMHKDVENFKLSNIKIDFNADTNYYLTEEDSNIWNGWSKCCMGLKYNSGFKYKNIKIHKVEFFRNPFWNSIIVMNYHGDEQVSDIEITSCDFIRGGDSANLGKNKVKDHSSIFISGRNNTIKNCRFINDYGSKISCGVEIHNFGVVSNNEFVNYAVPLHGVSMEGFGCKLSFFCNHVENAMYGFTHNCKDADSEITWSNNYVHLRSMKADINIADGMLYRHSGYESGGGINNASPIDIHDPKIYVLNNVFEQEIPDLDWEFSDFIVNNCFAVKEVRLFVAKGNVFRGFKGAILEILKQDGFACRSDTRIILEDNTYVDCGFSSSTELGFVEYNGAYVIRGNGVYPDFPLGRLYVSGDKFINCQYGSILCSPKATIKMEAVSISKVEVKGIFINPYFIENNALNTESEYSIQYIYEDDNVIPYTAKFNEPNGLMFDIKILRKDAYGRDYSEFRYVKPLKDDFYLEAKIYGQLSGQTVTGLFAPRIGDSVEIIKPNYEDFSKFLFVSKNSVKQWIGINKVA